MVLGAVVVMIVGIFVVNYFKDRRAEMLPGLSTQTETSKEYTVVKGDTLWAIAESYFGSGYNWVDIKSTNKLTTDKIEVGQKLTIPTLASKQPTSTQKIVAAPTVDTQQIVSENYTVVKGDTLWSIAVRTYGDGYKWVKIAHENHLGHPNVIHTGNVLVLPK